MKLVAIDYTPTIAQLKSVAARERVSLSDTRSTYWFRTDDNSGVCGAIEVAGRVRIKGVWVYPEWRGLGIGSAMTEALIKWIEQRYDCPIEVLAYNPAFYEARGFRRTGELANGAVRLEKRQ